MLERYFEIMQISYFQLLSLLFSHSVVSNHLQPHKWQRARLPCPSLFPGVCSNSWSLSWWCYSTIAFSVIPLLLCLQSFPASESFSMSQLFASCGQSIAASASPSNLPMNIKGWFPLGLTGLVSLLSKELSRVFSSTTVWKHQFCGAQPSLWSNSQIHTWLPEKTIALTIRTLVAKVISLPFKTLSRFVVALLPRGKPLLTSRFQLLSTVILDPKKIVCHCF